WFTGRHQALRDLGRWLRDDAAPCACVVTGLAGSGKTALLGMIAALSDPDQAPSVPKHGLPREFMVANSGITESIATVIDAGGMASEQVRDGIAAAAGLQARSVQELIDGLNRRGGDPVVVLIDTVDDAADPPGLISYLLAPLISRCRDSIRLLLGTRTHLLNRLGKPDGGRYQEIDLDSKRYADPVSIRAYTRRILLAKDLLDTDYTPSGIYQTVSLEHLDAVTRAIAAAAGTSFLVARIAATTEATSPSLPDPTDRRWLTSLPRRAGEAMRRDLELRLNEHAVTAAELLLPLAYAQGRGLPWEDIWPRLANALSPGRDYGNDDLVWLRRAAGSYALENLVDGRSVYRLYHRALAEYLLDGRDQVAEHRVITKTLLSLVPPRVGGGRDWAPAHPYSRTHLATHAARA
ncbi:MAG: peptidase C14 caspase catalytic subunit p20, partial [Actinobacteria bacterium]|nr:peptidase C14 caspase catalytic subunit p20 [Actinomycetota bacterium]